MCFCGKYSLEFWIVRKVSGQPASLVWADQHVFEHEDEFWGLTYTRIRTIGSWIRGCVIQR